MAHIPHALYGPPTYVSQATEDEPWDYEVYYGNLGPNFGLLHCVVEYDFGFLPDNSPTSHSPAPDEGAPTKIVKRS